MDAKTAEVFKFAKKLRPGGGEVLPLRYEDTDLSSVDEITGQFFIKIKDADLQQQEEIVRVSQVLAVRRDAMAVQEQRPLSVLQCLIDEKLLVSYRLPVVNAEGKLDVFALQENWKDPTAVMDQIKEKLSLPLASLIMSIVFDYFGLNPDSDAGEVVDDSGNLPALLEDQEETIS